MLPIRWNLTPYPFVIRALPISEDWKRLEFCDARINFCGVLDRGRSIMSAVTTNSAGAKYPYGGVRDGVANRSRQVD